MIEKPNDFLIRFSIDDLLTQWRKKSLILNLDKLGIEQTTQFMVALGDISPSSNNILKLVIIHQYKAEYKDSSLMDYHVEKHSGRFYNINLCSRSSKKIFDNEIDAFKQSVSFYNKKIHKKNKVYQIKDIYFQNLQIKELWNLLTSVPPCKVPFLECNYKKIDVDLVNRLRFLEL
jgi:hypothetical protein